MILIAHVYRFFNWVLTGLVLAGIIAALTFVPEIKDTELLRMVFGLCIGLLNSRLCTVYIEASKNGVLK